MPTVRYGGENVIFWGCVSAAGMGELYFIEGNMTPTCTVKYCS